MQVIFRPFPPDSDPVAPPSELHLRPAVAADIGRTDLARLALEKGPGAFVRGEGPVERLVVRDDPTLDDMLAVLLVEAALAGQPFAGARPFAFYTASLRQGVRPADALPVEDSPEGIFAAIRNDIGDNLAEPAKAARFLHAWERMAALIRPALAAGTDPHQQALFAGAFEFQQERQFLRRDQDVYRRDVRRGRRWTLSLPGEPAPVAGLLLVKPESSLFAFWARSDASAPAAAGYRFLAVSWGGGQWTFSTDPRDRLHIDTLAANLQTAEAARDPAAAARDPWYDGRHHGHTIVGAPVAGSRLTDEEVLGIVKRWGHVRSPGRRLRLTAAAGLVAVLAVTLLVAFRAFPRPGVAVGTEPASTNPLVGSRGGDGADPKDLDSFSAAAEEAKQRVDRARQVRLRGGEVGHAESFPLGLAGPVKFWLEFPLAETLPFREVRVQLPGAPAVKLAVAQDEAGVWRSEILRGNLPSDTGAVTASFANASAQDVGLDLRASWQPNRSGVLHLYVLAVGVSRYGRSSTVPSLRYAADDARDLSEVFRKERGQLFDEVYVHDPLLDEQADRRTIVNTLAELQEQVTRDPSPKLVVVLFSGHGAIVSDRYFVFLPADYDDTPATQLHWAELEAPLMGMKCPVWLVLDSCHSGQAAYQLAGAKGPPTNAEVEDAVRGFVQQKPGLLVLASALPRKRSYENDKWKHGALTLALLEALTGRSALEPGRPVRAGTGPVLTLGDVQNYVSQRVGRLTEAIDAQTIVPAASPGLNPSLIPLALNPAYQP